MHRLWVVIVLLGSVSSTEAQFFSPDVYQGRREALFDELQGALAIVPGLEGDGDHVLRQRRNLVYLAGVEEPNAYLVLDGKTRTSHLFLPDRTQFAPGQYPTPDRKTFREAPWNRPLRKWTPGAKAAAGTGIEEVHALESFWDVVGPLARKADRILVDYDDGETWAPAPLGPVHSKTWQVADRLREAVPGKSVENLAPLIQRMRLVKDAHEIEAMESAATITCEGINEVMRTLRPGQTEREIAGFLDYVWKKKGAQRVNFDSIVQSGPNSMVFYPLPWEQYDTYTRKAEEGDLLFLDVGAEHDFYASDVCRTIPVSGKFTAVQRKYYDIVLEAADAAIAATHPGATTLDVVRAAAEVYKKHGLDGHEDVQAVGIDKVWGVLPSPTHYIVNEGGMIRGVRGLGHHIGMDAIDRAPPNVTLEPGMVFTVEPKLYVTEHDFGIMIEDEVLVTENGARNLSLHSPRTADAIEAMMAKGAAR